MSSSLPPPPNPHALLKLIVNVERGVSWRYFYHTEQAGLIFHPLIWGRCFSHLVLHSKSRAQAGLIFHPLIWGRSFSHLVLHSKCRAQAGLIFPPTDLGPDFSYLVRSKSGAQPADLGPLFYFLVT